ncbi:apoptosis facilitator Bcl-2-like protein 14 isoform X2 [Ictalurus punctatus]|uniref:Apoptosis facilitator Bcl-2-like protein 14 isoform X2 n=1 Tax=Ictalurus punctatus TaxID=7998 RepID=A0A2D0T699_ICTPU|nr:apoptosis facilitator Bcl-2-like protein 14 isoform X2 [Ictalurus punctatus]
MVNGVEEQTTDQVEQLAQMFPKDSIEYKLLVKYTQKKKSTNSHPPQSNGVEEAKVASPTQPQDCHKSWKHKKKLKFWKSISCIRPVRESNGPVSGHPRRGASAESCPDQEEVEQIVSKLTKIIDRVHFISTDIETDSDDVVERIVELLREHGDKLNEEIEKNHVLRKQLQDSLSYGFFRKLAQTFLQRLSPEELPPTQSPVQAKIALTCELTSRLNTMDCHPMNRVLGFGAKYLQDYFSPWVIKQGGYEKVFGTDSDAEEEEVQ